MLLEQPALLQKHSRSHLFLCFPCSPAVRVCARRACTHASGHTHLPDVPVADLPQRRRLRRALVHVHLHRRTQGWARRTLRLRHGGGCAQNQQQRDTCRPAHRLQTLPLPPHPGIMRVSECVHACMHGMQRRARPAPSPAAYRSAVGGRDDVRVHWLRSNNPVRVLRFVVLLTATAHNAAPAGRLCRVYAVTGSDPRWVPGCGGIVVEKKGVLSPWTAPGAERWLVSAFALHFPFHFDQC